MLDGHNGCMGPGLSLSLLPLLLLHGAGPNRDTLGAILPKGPAKAAPLHFRFTCDYTTLAVKGEVLGHKRIGGSVDMTVGGYIRWHDLTLETSKAEGRFHFEKLEGLDQGFAYRRADVAHQFEPSFFAKFPKMPIEVRDLVWDTHMFEHFLAGRIRGLKLNESLKQDKKQDTSLAGAGTFSSASTDITWLAVTRMKGVPCALLQYRSFFNRLSMQEQGFQVDGSSQFGGEMWVSLRDGALIRGTLYEEVVAQVGNLGVFPTFRVGVIERVK